MERYSRGVAYAQKNDYNRAFADYNKAIELNPNDARPRYNNRGVAHSNESNYDRAIATTTRPKYAETYINRGLAFLHKGEHDLAIADYDKAIELNPKYDGAYGTRGITYVLRVATVLSQILM